MYCPEHLVFKALDSRIYLWMYWRDVPRQTIPLRIWLNPLRYELMIRVRRRVLVINPRGRQAVIFNNAVAKLRAAFKRKQTP